MWAATDGGDQSREALKMGGREVNSLSPLRARNGVMRCDARRGNAACISSLVFLFFVL